MSYLYVNNQGSTVAVDGGYFTVTQPDGLVRKIPSATLEYIAAFGNINFTTKAIQECIKNGVVVNFFSKNGTFFGKIESANNVKIGRQRQQFKLSGKTEFALELSKRIISAKIHNQLIVLGRYADNEKFADNFKQIKLAEKAVDNKKRGKLVKYLEKFAVRVQKSVFEGYLTKKNFTKLKNGIAGYISDEDSLRIYKLTGNGDVLSWGKGDIPENEDYIII